MFWNNNPFAIAPDEVQGLSDQRQVALINQIIRNRASRLDIPAEQIRTTLRTNNADGGIDAYVNTGRVADRILGTGASVWQFKKSFPAFKATKKPKPEIQIELEKPGVQREFKEGAGYTLVVGTQATPEKVRDLQEILTKHARQAECKGQVRLFVADDVAEWASDDPAVLLQIRPSLHGLKSAEEELRSVRHSTTFTPDAQRSSILDDLENRVLGPGTETYQVRLNGLAGVGKSRLALEAVSRLGLASSTFYASGPVSPEFFDLIAARQTATARIIVDECEISEHRKYVELAEIADGRIRLIAVGPGRHTGRDIYTLNPLDVGVVEQIVQRETGLPTERARWVARKTRGYVKLAVLVGRLVNRGSTNILDLSNDIDISKLVQDLISPDPRSKSAIRGIALLNRVGFKDGLEAEGQVVAEFVGLPWNEFRSALVDAIDQGIVSIRGRYWYVTPELLAIWLAGEFWKAQPERLGELLDLLPTPDARKACLDRISSLGEAPEVERVVAEDLLGPAGTFRHLSDISSKSTARIFASLVKGHPQAGLRSLQRIIGAVEEEELLAFKEGRQHVVWALRALMARHQTFVPAARLMRRLAETENEFYYSNNATDYWTKAFLVHFGQSECPPLERLPLIDESLKADNPKVKMLGAMALDAMLRIYESVGIDTPDEAIPPQYWKPSRWAEVAEIKREAFKRLTPLLNDSDPAVWNQAIATLRSEATGLVQLGLTDEVIAAFRLVNVDTEQERRDVWGAIRHILLSKKVSLTELQRRELDELSRNYFDDSLLSRMKRYMGPGSPANWDDFDWSSGKHDQVIASLADEANQSDEWLSLIDWLMSGDAHFVHPFARRLGEIDTDRRWLRVLKSAAIGAVDPRALTFYLVGWSQDGGRKAAHVEQLLDEWSTEPDHVSLVIDASLRLKPSQRGIRRLLSMIDSGALDPSLLRWLRIAELDSPKLTVEVLRRLIEDEKPEAIFAALTLALPLSERYDEGIPPEVKSALWEVLEAPGGWNSNPDTRYYWRQLAERLSEGEEIRITELLVDVVSSGDLAFEDERLSLLLPAGELYPQEALRLLKPLLVDSPENYKFQWALRDVSFFEKINPHAVEGWVVSIGEPAAAALSESIKIEPEELRPLARFLLVNFRDSAVDGLTREFLSGGWTGSAVPYWTEKLEAASLWSNDPDPNVRDWALDLVEYLERMISSAGVREAEEWWDRY